MGLKTVSAKRKSETFFVDISQLLTLYPKKGRQRYLNLLKAYERLEKFSVIYEQMLAMEPKKKKFRLTVSIRTPWGR